MRRYLLYLTLIFFAFFTFVNSTSKCTEGEDGFMVNILIFKKKKVSLD